MHVRQRHPLEVLYSTNKLIGIRRSSKGGPCVEALAIAHTHTNYLPTQANAPILQLNMLEGTLHSRNELPRKAANMNLQTPLSVLRHGRELLFAAKLLRRRDIASAFEILVDAYMVNFDIDVDTARHMASEDVAQMDVLLASLQPVEETQRQAG